MQTIILKEHLERAVTALSRIITQKAQLPILSNILLTSKPGELTLAATNLNESIVITLPAKIEVPGEITVPGKLFSEFVHLLPQKPITLLLKGQSLHVACENVQADFAYIPATEFPTLPKFGTDATLALTPITLESLVSEVSFAASKDEGRPVLTGVLVKMAEKKLTMVATDGFRLSIAEAKTNHKGHDQLMLIPAKTLEELVKLTKDFSLEKEGQVSFSLLKEQNQLVARFGSIDFSSRLLEGQFPDWQKVVPKDLTTTITLARDELLSAVRLASVFSRDGLSVVKMTVTTEGLVLASDAKEIGNDMIDVPAEVEGEGGEIAFNPRFLLELLQTITTETLSITMSGPLSPAIFRKQPQDAFLHVIMPVRT